MSDMPIESPDVVITAARLAEQRDETPASVTIIDEERIVRLGEPLAAGFLRLTPSVAIASSGPAGSLTEVRIRGAETNHTLLFIDGIKVNDPAAGNAPRFELLNADIVSRMEVVRGPQSALWGSEAIGGVVAVNGIGADADELSARAQAGSLGFRRGAASASLAAANVNAAGAVGWQRATGIDAFDGSGDRDGYRNLSGRARVAWTPSEGIELGAAALALSGRSEFDGYDPLTFLRADTADSSRNRLSAASAWGRFASADERWSASLTASLLGSRNRNQLAGSEINRTAGGRTTVGAQGSRAFKTAAVRHRLTIAAEHVAERFEARDTIYGGATDQDRRRDQQALSGEWRAEAGPVDASVAVRHDRFDSFRDSTALRAGAQVELGAGLAVAGSYGEGIAQPNFFDLYGFFPGNFVGNPSLAPERSRGVEASLRFRRDRVRAAATVYRQRLRDEIVDVFDSTTFQSSTANRPGTSRRSGIELEAGYEASELLNLSAHYSYLSASEPLAIGSGMQREARRPRHSGAILADGRSGALSYGFSVAYTGARRDTDFDAFPARPVRLGAYWLAGAQVAYAVRPDVELFARAANAFDQRYEDVYANRTEGRTIHAGIRLARRR